MSVSPLTNTHEGNLAPGGKSATLSALSPVVGKGASSDDFCLVFFSLYLSLSGCCT